MLDADDSGRNEGVRIRFNMDNHFTRDNIGFMEQALTFQKRALTKAVRIAGPFTVETKEGTLRCEDGYLTLDIDGNPYPMERDVFERTYMPIGYKDR